MKLILYIGHHKVGSTALQLFLSRNWLALARAGILYPGVESRGLALNLAQALGAAEPGPPGDVNIREPHSALAYRMMAEVSRRKVPGQFRMLPAVPQMMAAIRQQAARIAPHTLVLCSEAFINFGEVDAGLIERLGNLFPDADITVYCALRRPDDYMMSWHNQRLKVGECPPALSAGAAAAYVDTIHFDYRAAVEPWAAGLPRARLVLRDYADILAAGGSVEDFAARTGLDLPQGLAPAERANESLPRAAMEIVRLANRDLPGPQSAALRRALMAAPRDLSPVAAGDIEMFGAPLRAQLAERFAPIHDYLGGLAGLTGRPFFAGLDDMAQPRPVPEAEAAAALLARLGPETLPEDPEIHDFIARLRQAHAA